MAGRRNTDKVVKNPTFMADIRYFFEDPDIRCMNDELEDFDLSTYEGVRSNASRIFRQTLPPRGKMPPQKDRKWSEARSESFLNWINNESPRGVPFSRPVPKEPVSPTARVRKDIRDLDKDELKLLKDAFDGIIQREPDEPNSYFQVAAIHGIPDREYCLHHEMGFHPWHRAYLLRMENALRSVPGCGEVTLPYWDISGTVPAVLFKEPFASFTLPRRVGAEFPEGFVTVRNERTDVQRQLRTYRMADKIHESLQENYWETFNDSIEGRHDSGHGICGETISDADVTAYDPMFWFFHCNWDRLWWRWQHRVDATTLNRFKSTLLDSSRWLEPPVNDLEPFDGATTDGVIDVSELHYALSRDDRPFEPAETGFGNIIASTSFRLSLSRKVSVRVKGIKRLNIPGSFKVSLLADGKLVDWEGFFQSTAPKRCTTCRQKDIVNIDFKVDLEKIKDKTLSVTVDLVSAKRAHTRVSLKKIGNPTINVRQLLVEG